MIDHTIVNCPHCQDSIFIASKDFNCKIFRHGVYKHNKEGISPHLCKQECDRLRNNDLIYGCGRPFQLILVNNKYIAINCDYI